MTKTISYVFPIYNESGNINLLYDTMIKTVEPLAKKYSFEFVFVNDGSRDNSLELLKKIADDDERVTIVDLARNFGHQLAVTAGIDKSNGDAIIIMDSDMQDPPAVSLQLINQWGKGFEVVYAQRRSRKDSFFKKLTADLYYRVLHNLADIDIPRNTGDFRLIDKKVADQLSAMPEHNRFLRGMVSWIGFKQTAVQFDRDERHAGVTGYPLKKMLKFAADGVFSFSSAPLKLISKTGYLIAALAFIGIVYALTIRLFFPAVTVEGWTFIVISILFMGGIQLIMLGVLGSYIGRIYTEVQNRPLYGIKDIYEKKQKK